MDIIKRIGCHSASHVALHVRCIFITADILPGFHQGWHLGKACRWQGTCENSREYLTLWSSHMVQPDIIWTLYWGADRVKTLLCLIQLIHLHSNVHLLWVMSRKLQGFSICVERAFLSFCHY